MAREMSEERELMLFQDYFPHLAAPVTDKERKQVRFLLDLQENMKNGWLSKAIEQLRAKNAERAADTADYNAFEDVPQYGMNRRSANDRVPRFSDYPFGGSHTFSFTLQTHYANSLFAAKEHFPKELWDVIDPKGESEDPNARKKKLKLSTKSNRDKLAAFDDDEAEAEADAEEAEEKDPEDELDKELEDDEFEEDEEDDMADDYNAERYFSGGDEDYEDGGGGDGGDDDGY